MNVEGRSNAIIIKDTTLYGVSAGVILASLGFTATLLKDLGEQLKALDTAKDLKSRFLGLSLEKKVLVLGVLTVACLILGHLIDKKTYQKLEQKPEQKPEELSEEELELWRSEVKEKVWARELAESIFLKYPSSVISKKVDFEITEDSEGNRHANIITKDLEAEKEGIIQVPIPVIFQEEKDGKRIYTCEVEHFYLVPKSGKLRDYKGTLSFTINADEEKRIAFEFTKLGDSY